MRLAVSRVLFTLDFATFDLCANISTISGNFSSQIFFTSLDAAGAALAAVRVENRKTCAEIP